MEQALNNTSRRNKIRVLIAKPGLDGHDRGAKVIARALRDAGFEVIYTGLHQTPEMIVKAAIQEDVHVIGISVLSGAHNALVPEVIKGVRSAGLSDTLVLVGGIIPEEDVEGLKTAGTAMVFTPGTALEDIIKYIDKNAPAR
jgi:methylmalonyl-CoA mutase C-terminal domain/subunit